MGDDVVDTISAERTEAQKVGAMVVAPEVYAALRKAGFTPAKVNNCV